MKKILKFLYAFAVLFLLNFSVTFADDPGDPGGPPDPNDPPVGGNAPLDAGAIFVLLSGAAYGILKLKGNRNKKTKFINKV